MSPEQATGKHIGGACDIYSLGVIAYEALAGHPPFDGRTLAEVVCMHKCSEPDDLRTLCTAPSDLCDLVHRMLEKDASLRPSAIEVRQRARAIAIALTSAYAEFEVTGGEAEQALPRPAHRAHLSLPRVVPTDEVEVIDPDALEFGITERLPAIRRPRWTPEIGYAIAVMADAVASEHNDRSRMIGPRAASDQVAGEIESHVRRRT
jgi:serine/threonine protein kinase